VRGSSPSVAGLTRGCRVRWSTSDREGRQPKASARRMGGFDVGHTPRAGRLNEFEEKEKGPGQTEAEKEGGE